MRRLALRGAAALGLVSLLGGAGLVADAWQAFGQMASGPRLERMERSPQRGDGVFVNAEPMWVGGLESGASWFTRSSPYAEATEPLPVVFSQGEVFQQAPETGLRVTWFGHSTALLEIDGVTVLTDPIWGQRASPWDWMGPKRWYAPAMPLSALPPLDVVLLSHDHYDHLQMDTVLMLKDQDVTWVAPLGVGSHLEYWGVPSERIVELDWWEQHQVGELGVTATPARHASGRQVFDQNHTLWASYALVGPEHRVYFGGDTGLFSALEDIGERLGPFDLTMLEVGAYDRNWPDWHLGPEQAVKAHQWLGDTGVMMPIHWGLWNLALHGWTEPAQRVTREAEARGVSLAMPRPGESFEPALVGPLQAWWPDDLPWQTAEEHPVVARGLP